MGKGGDTEWNVQNKGFEPAFLGPKHSVKHGHFGMLTCDTSVCTELGTGLPPQIVFGKVCRWRCLWLLQMERRVIRTSGGQRPGMLLNPQERPGQLPEERVIHPRIQQPLLRKLGTEVSTPSLPVLALEVSPTRIPT